MSRPQLLRSRSAQWLLRAGLPVLVALISVSVALASPGGTVGLGAGRFPTLLPSPRTRVLILGDSVAATLGAALGIEATRDGVFEVDAASLGCGVAIQQAVISQGQLERMVPECNSASPPSRQWPAEWRRLVDKVRPQVVVILAGRWETQTVEIGGRWTSILAPGYDRYVRSQLDLAVRTASAGGARVELLTAPCFEGGQQADGQPWPENDPARLAAYNRDVWRVAEAHPTTTSVFDLDALVCPGGHFTPILDGVRVRDKDGIHFPSSYSAVYLLGRWLGPRVWPGLLTGQSPSDRLAAHGLSASLLGLP